MNTLELAVSLEKSFPSLSGIVNPGAEMDEPSDKESLSLDILIPKSRKQKLAEKQARKVAAQNAPKPLSKGEQKRLQREQEERLRKKQREEALAILAQHRLNVEQMRSLKQSSVLGKSKLTKSERFSTASARTLSEQVSVKQALVETATTGPSPAELRAAKNRRLREKRAEKKKNDSSLQQALGRQASAKAAAAEADAKAALQRQAEHRKQHNERRREHQRFLSNPFSTVPTAFSTSKRSIESKPQLFEEQFEMDDEDDADQQSEVPLSDSSHETDDESAQFSDIGSDAAEDQEESDDGDLEAKTEHQPSGPTQPVDFRRLLRFAVRQLDAADREGSGSDSNSDDAQEGSTDVSTGNSTQVAASQDDDPVTRDEMLAMRLRRKHRQFVDERQMEEVMDEHGIQGLLSMPGTSMSSSICTKSHQILQLNVEMVSSQLISKSCLCETAIKVASDAFCFKHLKFKKLKILILKIVIPSNLQLPPLMKMRRATLMKNLRQQPP